MKVIILAGGKGTRLWPMSREKYSKQLRLVDNTSYSDNQKSFNFITLDKNLHLHTT